MFIVILYSRVQLACLCLLIRQLEVMVHLCLKPHLLSLLSQFYRHKPRLLVVVAQERRRKEMQTNLSSSTIFFIFLVTTHNHLRCKFGLKK